MVDTAPIQGGTRRDQIERTASAMFRERGYSATSVRDLARALDMQGASLYAHVASKEDVLWSIVDGAADRFDAAVAPIAAEDGPASDRLRRMIRGHIGVVATDLGSAAVFFNEWRYLSPDRRSAIAARRDAYEGHWRRVIADGVDAGALDPSTDVHLAAMLVLSALNGIASWYRPDGRLGPDEIAERYGDLLLRGLEGSAR